MNTFPLKLLAADQVCFDGECSSLVIPSADGQYGIMAKHCNAVVAIVPGVATVTTANDEKIIFFVSSGIAKIDNGSVLILAEACENAKDINEARAKNALKEAQAEKNRRESRISVLSAEVKIARAMNRLKAREHLN